MKRLLTHKAANYRASTTDRKRCGTCSMFTAGKIPGEARCSLVERPIRASGVCDYYEPSQYSAAEPGGAVEHRRSRLSRLRGG